MRQNCVKPNVFIKFAYDKCDNILIAFLIARAWNSQNNEFN